MKKLFYAGLVILLTGCAREEIRFSDYPISAVDIRNVSLNDSFWLPKIKIIQQTTIAHSFEKCKEEGRMENFFIAAQKMQGIEGKIRGKMPFDDTDLYKIIEGASYTLISFPDPHLEAYLDSVIAIIKMGQEPDGYLTTWITVDPSSPPAEWVKAPNARWAGEISSHELYNSGHLFEAAVAHYQATGKRNFLDIALKNADLLVKTFGPGKKRIASGHQIVETGLVKLYRVTGETKYLELAKFLLDERGDPASHTLYGAYNQDHIPVIQQDEVIGHAVRGLYMYAGMTDIAALYGDSTYLNAVNRLWENMVYKKMYLTGGLGARHDGEAFGDNYELPNLTAYSETCAAIGSVYWNQRLFWLTGDSKYYDIIERTLYNGLLSGISLDGTEFFYPNPLEADGKFDFNKGACTRQSWFDCSCCPTNLIRFIPSVPGLIYSMQRDSVYINLYVAGKADLSVNDSPVTIVQETGYPWEGQINITVSPRQKQRFTVKIRIPGWARNQAVPGDLYAYTVNNPEKVMIRVNGEEQELRSGEGYVTMTREWEKNDRIEMSLPMTVRQVVSHEKVSENQNKVALEYGPFVYCAEEIDNMNLLSGAELSAQSVFTSEKHPDLPDGVVALMKHPLGKEDSGLVFIPYYAWSNRGVGQMKVWFPMKKN